jgi:hypothetical protein
MHFHRFPSTAQCRLECPLPRLDAKSVSLSGHLVLFDECEQVEFTFPWGRGGRRQEASGVEVTANWFREIWEDQYDANVTVRHPYPQLPLGAPMIHHTPRAWAWVVWESGGTSLPRGRYARGTTEDDHDVTGARWEFKRHPKEAGPPQQLVVRAFVQEGLGPRLPFVIRDIPLPDSRPAPTESPSETQPPRRAHWVDGPEAGSLAFDVLIDDQPLPGPLRIGVSMARRKEDGTHDEWSTWYEWIDEKGRVRIAHLKPGHYALRRSGQFMGRASPREFRERLGRHFGIDADRHIWINDYAHAEAKAGEETELSPLRFVPRMTTLSPVDGGLLPKAELEFSWEPFPDAASYVVALGVRPPSVEGHTFWVSDPVTETHVRYDPETGHIQNEQDRQFLDLDPEMRYYWWVSALNAEGMTIARAHGLFQVK